MTEIARLGEPLPLPVPSAELKAHLARRRSAPAQDLAAPGPARDELTEMLRLATRVPDHGKMTPWRFVVLSREARAEVAETLAARATQQNLPPKAIAVLAKLTAAPVTVLVVSTAAPGPKPVWEQQLSAGALCMNLEHAASAFGYSTCWITDWYSYDATAASAFGVRDGEQIAGFIHIGTAPTPPLERERPDLDRLVEWRA